MTRNVIWYSELGMNDVEIVGGKNASLGEMIANLAQSGVRVPNGFATTADAYRQFLTYEGLAERINSMLAKLDIDDVAELASTGKAIREAVLKAPFPEALDQDRSEERRVGQECVSTCSSRWSTFHSKKKYV